jgi:hypothetical protein
MAAVLRSGQVCFLFSGRIPLTKSAAPLNILLGEILFKKAAALIRPAAFCF